MQDSLLLPGIDSAILSHLLTVSFGYVINACSRSFCSAEVQGVSEVEVSGGSYLSDGAEAMKALDSFPAKTVSSPLAFSFEASFRPESV